MEVSRAKAFLAVADELHFGRAAARLHIAQPPLSRMIRSIEKELGVTLFLRSSRHIELTAVGAALIAPARELVMQSERIDETARRVNAGEYGRVRLGFSGSSVGVVVSGLARALRKAHPGIALEMHGAQFSEPGVQRLTEGQLDAVIGRWDFLPSDIDSCVLSTDQLVVALPKRHRLAQQRNLSPAQLAEEPWVILPGGPGATLASRLQMLGTVGRFVPREIQIAEDSATQLLLVDVNVGIALTFASVQEHVPANQVVFIPVFPDLGPVEVRLAWRNDQDNPALRQMIQVAMRTS